MGEMELNTVEISTVVSLRAFGQAEAIGTVKVALELSWAKVAALGATLSSTA